MYTGVSFCHRVQAFILGVKGVGFVREQFLQVGFVRIGICPGDDDFAIETEIDFGKERMYDVVNGGGYICTTYYISPIVLHST